MHKLGVNLEFLFSLALFLFPQAESQQWHIPVTSRNAINHITIKREKANVHKTMFKVIIS